VTPSKGKDKVPTNMDEVDNRLIISSLPKWVIVECLMVGHMATIKFEDCDLADTSKFLHLETGTLMEQSGKGTATTL